MKRFLPLTAIAILASVASSNAATLAYDWTPAGDQGLLGWTNVKIDSVTYAPTVYAFFDNGAQLGAPRDAFGTIPTGAQDTAHTTIVTQSPVFTVTSTTSISFTLSEGSSTAILAGNFASLPVNSIQDTGYIGLALMRVSDGAYLLNRSKVSNGTPDEAFTFSSIDIATATVGDSPTEQYALQLIDYKHGGWGHIGLKGATLTNVNVVPEPASAGLILLGLAGFALNRKR